jgi:amino acid exporter
VSVIEPDLAGVLLAYAVALPGFLSPGPNIMAVIGTSLGAGRDAGTALAPGVAAGSLCWGLLGLVGLTALLASHAARPGACPP